MRTKWLFLFSFLSNFKCHPWTCGSLSAELQSEQEGEDAGTGRAAVAVRGPPSRQHRRKRLQSAGKPTPTHTCTALAGMWGGALGCHRWFGMHGIVNYSFGTQHSEATLAKYLKTGVFFKCPDLYFITFSRFGILIFLASVEKSQLSERGSLLYTLT